MTVLICGYLSLKDQPFWFLTVPVQYQSWVIITAFGAAVSDAKRVEGLSISSSTNADGLPAAARDAVVADHPI